MKGPKTAFVYDKWVEFKLQKAKVSHNTQLYRVYCNPNQKFPPILHIRSRLSLRSYSKGLGLDVASCLVTRHISAHLRKYLQWKGCREAYDYGAKARNSCILKGNQIGVRF